MKNVVLVTGASSGIGEATVKKLLSEGDIVYASARNTSKMQHLKDLGAKIIELDVTKTNTIKKALEQIVKEQGRIDVLFNNAGYGLYGTVEETSMEDAKNQFEVNLFGLAQLTQHVIPYMRKQKSGKIINTSSMGGKVYTPLGAWYHATKHALEGWSDCLRLELAQFNIKVVIIEPGGIQTNWGIIASEHIERISLSGPYKEFSKKVAEGMRKRYGNKDQLTPPLEIANVVNKAIRSKNPKTRYVKGKYAGLLMFVRKWFGDRFYDWLIMNQS